MTVQSAPPLPLAYDAAARPAPPPPALSQTRAAARGSSMRPYVATWLILALLAAGYLLLAALRPDLAAGYLGARYPGEPESNEGQRAMSKALAEVQTMRQGLEQVQLDVSRLKTESKAREEQDKAVAARIAALEGSARLASGGSSTPAAAGVATAPAAAAPAPQAAAPVAAAKAAPKTAAALDADLKVLNAPAPVAGEAGIETGSVAPLTGAAQTAAAAAAPVAFGAPVVTPTPRPAAVHLGTGSSVDALRLSWSLLSEMHGDALRKLEPRYTASGNQEQPSYELLAGPLRSPADAKRLCRTLQAKGVPCKVETYDGNAL